MTWKAISGGPDLEYFIRQWNKKFFEQNGKLSTYLNFRLATEYASHCISSKILAVLCSDYERIETG